MHRPHHPDLRSRLLPPGQRWGFGAHSVVPYLTHALSTRAAGEASAEAIRNPVFPHMEKTLRALRRHQ